MLRRKPLVSAAKFALLCLLVAPAFAQDADLDRELKRITDVYALVEERAADPVSPDQAFYQGAIPGLLRRLDPHSVFFDPGQFEQLQQMERSTSKGFGSIVSVLPGRVIVLQTLPGTPSARSGISPGDEILAVNNIRLDRLSMDQLIQLLTESRQRPAQLYVRREGSSRLLSFTLTPEEMQSKSVDRAFLLEPGIGYVRVESFEPATGSQLHEAIEQLGGEKLKGLVLDLRNNPGGVVNAALETCAMFLDPGQKILTVRGRKVPEQDQKVPASAHPYKFKLAVLLNEKTASASEIVAGALQDHDRATILGVPSFGKGLVQSVFPLSEKTGVALTTALYYTPSGRSIQKPLHGGDFELSNTASHPNEQSEFKTDKGRTVRGGGGITPDIIAEPQAHTQLTAVLEQSGIFLSFATEYMRNHKVDESFEVTPEVLDQFEQYAAERRIRPGVADWATNRDFVTHRVKAEIFNQALGVEKGDAVDIRYQPEVQQALEVLK
jgi:carboxyl-terminal processing protease